MGTLKVQGILGCLGALAMMLAAYRGGPVQYGTIAMPREGRILIFICAIIIFVVSLKRLLIATVR
jgi:hypothetical protein